MSQEATTRRRARPAAQPARPAGGAAPAVQRQLVNFAFYKLDPAFRRLGDHEKIQARSEFLKVFDQRREGLICLTYSTVGLRPDCDFLLWRIAGSTDAFQEQTKAINKTRLGGYLTTPWSFVSMTKRSMYVDKLDPFHTPESRTHIIPGKRKYLFVYPFVKTRDWYLLPLEERQAIMDVHIKVGQQVPEREAQHDLQLRPRRPGLRRRVRDRRAEGLPRPGDGAARDAEQQVHPARHADLHVRADADGERAGPVVLRRRSTRDQAPSTTTCTTC